MSGVVALALFLSSSPPRGIVAHDDCVGANAGRVLNRLLLDASTAETEKIWFCGDGSL